MAFNYFDIFSKAGDTVIETAKHVADINTKVGEELIEQQVELAGQFMQAAAKQADLVAKAKGYQDVIGGQAQIAQEYGQQLLAGYKRVTEIMTEAGKSVVSTADQVAKDARENFAKAAA